MRIFSIYYQFETLTKRAKIWQGGGRHSLDIYPKTVPLHEVAKQESTLGANYCSYAYVHFTRTDALGLSGGGITTSSVVLPQLPTSGGVINREDYFAHHQFSKSLAKSTLSTSIDAKTHCMEENARLFLIEISIYHKKKKWAKDFYRRWIRMPLREMIDVCKMFSVTSFL